MMSLMYPTLIPMVTETLHIRFEWFKPTEEEIKGLSTEMKEHVRKGGLDLRNIECSAIALGNCQDNH